MGGGRFCGKCGAAVGGETVGTEGAAAFEIGDFHLTDSHLGALAYLTPIPAIAFLAVEPYRSNRFVRFHSCQCLLLTAAVFAANLASVMVSFLGAIQLLFSVAVDFALVAFWILAAFKAFQGEKYRLPLIGDIALRLSRQPL